MKYMLCFVRSVLRQNADTVTIQSVAWYCPTSQE